MFDIGTSNLQEGGKILDGIDDGSTSEKPDVVGLNQVAEVSTGITTAETMCLVVDEAVPGLVNLEGLDEGCFPQGGLVANDIDVCCERECLCFGAPGVVGGVRDEDVDFGLQEDRFPLLNDCHGGDEKGMLAHLGLDEAGHLDGFAESHLVGEDSAFTLSLTLKHPADAGFLVLHVLKVGPERHELFRLGFRQGSCSTFCVSTGNNGREGGNLRSSRVLAGWRGRFWLGRSSDGSARLVLREHV